jgi:hypothetical protein
MKLISRCRTFGVLCAVLTLAHSDGADVRRSLSPYDFPKPSSCSAPEYRQFDFWLGDWDAFESGNPRPAARVRVTGLLDGCVVHEDYQDANGKKGQSFSMYDASRKVWHQSWVTNRGELLVIEGSYRSGEMILTGAEVAGETKTLVRGTWTPLKDGVREVGVTSIDDGKTWQAWFDLVFRPHRQ